MVKEALEILRLNQTDLACLLNVTPRTVNTWVTDGKEAPGPVQAYLRLLMSLEPSQLEKELKRLNKENRCMKEGMFKIQIQGSASGGTGILVFENGSVYGVDEANVKYDGSSEYNADTGFITMNLKITVPPYVETVQGHSHPHEWSFNVKTSFPANANSYDTVVKTPIGDVTARISYMRPLQAA